MSDRREVNVGRPEHSWIPFYRELAEKLVEDGWRERQGELVRMLKEMGNEGLPVPKPLKELPVDHIDPFSFYASFNYQMTKSNRAEMMFALADRFEIVPNLKTVAFYVPDITAQNAIFFNWEKQRDYVKRVEHHWNMFEFVLNADPFADGFDERQFLRLMDNSLDVTGVGVAKLTGAFYWINPFKFLESKTLRPILKDAAFKRISDSETYLAMLQMTNTNVKISFPEFNDQTYLINGKSLGSPKLWLVRGGSKRFAVRTFLSQDRVGIGFGLESVPLSGISTRRELERKYKENRPDGDGRDVNQLTDFMLKMEVGDYMIMPDGETTHCGMIASRPYRREDGPLNHSRRVKWSLGEIDNRKLPSLPPYVTIKELDDEIYDKFLSETELISNEVTAPVGSGLQIPEDSWVPFHLEVGRKLIEGEWWLEEKRDELARMIRDIRWSDPGEPSEDGTYGQWSADPYSFYLSFNMRMVDRMREPAHRRVKELFDVEASLPSGDYHTISLGVNWGWEPSLNDEEIDFLWELFRFVVDFDPASCGVGDERRFVEFYDRAASRSFLLGKRAGWLSIWLCWIDPTKYVATRRLSRQALNLETELGVRADLPTGQDYLDALRGLRGLGATNGFGILDVNRASTTRRDLGLDGSGTQKYGVEEMLDDGVFLEEKDIHRMKRILESKKNLILQGPPGVGKTFIARKLAYVLMERKDEKRVTSVQFHQSYSYEDFVGGFRPSVGDNGQMIFTRQNGPFLDVCAKAQENPDVDHVILIDEINRGNLSRVFGELLMLIEADKRKPEFGVTLQHRPDDEVGFFVPENVYIIGTMNLADRSLTGMNVAMRRRFGFVDLKPQFKEKVFTDWLSEETDMPPGMQDRINAGMATLNSTIAVDPSLGVNYAVGHSFFCPPDGVPEGGWEEWYETVVEYEIRPLLREYWFDAPDTANAEADKLR